MNPYGAPQARIAEAFSGERLPVESSGRWRRFFGFLVDYACILLLRCVAIVILSLVARMVGNDVLDDAMAGVIYIVAWFATMLLYYLILEAGFGWTIGKLVTGTRVVDAEGLRPRWGRVVVRSLVRFIPLEALTLWLSDEDVRRGWHDWLSKTWVVRCR